MDLPKLNPTPTRHPDLCLSISTTLLQTLSEILTTTDGGPDTTGNNLILSVGSGSGLLEAHLQDHIAPPPSRSSPPGPTCPCPFTVKGIEVRAPTPVNRYLPAPQAPTVRGTWEVHPSAGAADTLMFVYPRDPGLVGRYLGAAGQGGVRVVLWLGPRADWSVFGGCFGGVEGFGEVEVVEGARAGVAEFEMVAVLRRRGRG
ncbi:hypothetical protein KVR01_007126 [Diaporthe batatas]|uniref:uncharacterized protein n=1 Tax=Diaporthe batatas TaxID=748121 RepID=UPI001D056A23|nr:uncharacterized protein KVR01_007126 [Diaporthe batatas]KAG8162648.1 hypothetical protein KVR01_007126 [Diaporthe batatas]